MGQNIGENLSYLEQIKQFFVTRGMDIVIALVILVIGVYIAKFIRRSIHKVMDRAAYDNAVSNFISEIVYYAILILVVLTALSKAGVPTNSFLAAFGAFGIAIGLALQGNMSNFASGLLILMFKPFKAGDTIMVNNQTGQVQRIQLLHTCLMTRDYKTVFIPNSLITSQNVVNFNYTPTRYIPFVFDIGYNNDHHRAMSILREVFRNDERVLNADNIDMGIKNFGDNSVQIEAYVLVNGEDYLATYYAIMSAVKDAFDAHGIDIPYPQRVVYVEKFPGRKEGED